VQLLGEVLTAAAETVERERETAKRAATNGRVEQRA
jgi:hypothetical protein